MSLSLPAGDRSPGADADYVKRQIHRGGSLRGITLELSYKQGISYIIYNVCINICMYMKGKLSLYCDGITTRVDTPAKFMDGSLHIESSYDHLLIQGPNYAASLPALRQQSASPRGGGIRRIGDDDSLRRSQH